MSESVSFVGAERPYTRPGWSIYRGPAQIAYRIHLEPELLQFTQDVASLICAKTKLPLWRFTGPGQSPEVGRGRKYLAFFLRYHPYAVKYGTFRKSGYKGLSYTRIGDIINREHSTVMSGERRLIELMKRSEYQEGAEVAEISSLIWRRFDDYGYLDVLPWTDGRRRACDPA